MTTQHAAMMALALLGALALAGCDDAASDADATGGAASGGTASPGGSPANTGGSGGASTGATSPGGGGGGGQGEACLGPEYGWEMGPECLAAHQALCAAQTEATCESVAYCRMGGGERLDLTLQCREAYGGFCISWAAGCGPAPTLARDHDGHTWSFIDTCIPYEWEYVSTANLSPGWDWTFAPCGGAGGGGAGGAGSAGGGGSSAD